MADRGCAHLNAIITVKHAKKRECEECVKTGDSWVHLRTCQECGRTLCCDNSPNRHASRHAKPREPDDGRPVMRPFAASRRIWAKV